MNMDRGNALRADLTSIEVSEEEDGDLRFEKIVPVKYEKERRRVALPTKATARL